MALATRPHSPAKSVPFLSLSTMHATLVAKRISNDSAKHSDVGIKKVRRTPNLRLELFS